MSFDKWRKRLAGEKVPTFTQPDEQDEGYYRKPITEKQPNGRNKIVGWIPVAIFLDDGKLVGAVGVGDGARDMDLNDCEAIWTWCVQHPISYEAYVAAERGEPWPDLQAAPADVVPAANREVTTTDNAPPAEEVPLGKRLGEGIDNAIAAAPTAVTSEAEAAIALGSKNRLAELRLEADKAGKAEYEPHYRLYKKLHGQWTPMLTRASDKEKALEKLILTFRQAERKRIADEQAAEDARLAKIAADRKAEQDAIEAANARAADRAIAAGEPEPEPEVLPELMPEAMPVALPVQPAPVVATYGTRRLKEEERWWLDAITDQDAVYNHFKANPKVVALLIELATSAVKSGVTVPGTATHYGLV